MTNEYKKNFLETVIKYWPIIIFALVTVGAWFTLQYKVEANTNDIKGIQTASMASIKDQQVVNNQVLVQLSAIQTDLQWLKARLK